MYQRLAHEADQYGNITHLTQRSLVDGAPVGRWIMIQRGAHRRGQLTPARTHALERSPAGTGPHAPRLPPTSDCATTPSCGRYRYGGWVFRLCGADRGCGCLVDPRSPGAGGEGRATTSTDEVVFVHVFEECAVE